MFKEEFIDFRVSVYILATKLALTSQIIESPLTNDQSMNLSVYKLSYPSRKTDAIALYPIFELRITFTRIS